MDGRYSTYKIQVKISLSKIDIDNTIRNPPFGLMMVYGGGRLGGGVLGHDGCACGQGSVLVLIVRAVPAFESLFMP